MKPDAVAPFQPEGVPARGRYVWLGEGALDPILRRHDYPRAAALLLGEALALAALIGALFKVRGRLVIQAEGDGPVALLVAEYAMGGDLEAGGLRGYVRVRPDAAAAIDGLRALPPAALLGGEGTLVISLDQGPDADLMQGVVALEGATLAACAEAYFERSEQTRTRIRLAVGEESAPGQAPVWRAGGALLQRIAADDARSRDEESWETAETLFATLADHELIDPALGPEAVLYRLFHEGGVRLGEAHAIEDRCGCDPGRVAALLKRYPPEEIADLVEPDGLIHASCQFCARRHVIDPATL